MSEPTRKRRAEKDLVRDGTDSSGDDNPTGATFASAEELKTRKIVRVKRPDTAPKSAIPNLFQAISDASTTLAAGQPTFTFDWASSYLKDKPEIKSDPPARASDTTIGQVTTQSIFGKSGTFSFKPPEALDTPAAQPQQPAPGAALKLEDPGKVVTGEEEEDTKFEAKAKLFLKSGLEWKERGIGVFRVNASKSDPKKIRMLMREERTRAALLNVPIDKTFSVVSKDPKGFIFSSVASGNVQAYLLRGLKSDASSTENPTHQIIQAIEPLLPTSSSS
jgi:hypothetical protein